MSDIDPVEFGRLTAKVERLQVDVSKLNAHVESLISMLEQAKGGWRDHCKHGFKRCVHVDSTPL